MTHRPLLLALALLAALVGLVASRADAGEPKALAPVADALAAGDPLAFDPSRVAELERRAAFGHSHVLYARSPDGIVETARRTARWRGLIEEAVGDSGFSPDVVEGIVLLESAGRPDAIAGDGPLVASGLTQIMGGTANDMLGMDVNLYASGILTAKIRAAHARGAVAEARRLEARRRQVDGRFDPVKALAATIRYLEIARGHLGRDDLAVASYHMGIGNLQDVVAAYGEGGDVSYARLYFGSAPDRKAAAWRILAGLHDDSLHYYFKVLAAKRVMQLYRERPAELAALAELHARKSSAEEVFHPSSRTRVFRRPQEIAAARAAGELLWLPNQPATLGFEVSPFLGSQARALGTGRGLYRALRPEALATVAYLGQRVREIAGGGPPIVVTSAVRDWRYQRRLMLSNPMAARAYSVHTTGYAFDLSRNWASERQAAAVQFALDRLQSWGLVTYIKEPEAIHVAVHRDAGKLLAPALLAEAGKPSAGGVGETSPVLVPPRAQDAPPAAPGGPAAQAERSEQSWLSALRDALPF